MNKKEDYYIYSHSEPHITTMGDFVTDTNSIGIGLDIAQTLIYEDEDGVENLDKLILLYTKDELVKYKSLIDQIRNTKPVQDQTTTTTSTSNVSIEKSQSDLSTTSQAIRVRNIQALTQALDLNGDKPLKLSDNDNILLSKLHDDTARRVFRQFMADVSIQTPYTVSINNTFRSVEEEKELKKKNKSAATVRGTFNYHLAGLAMDINLIPKDPTTHNQLNSYSTIKEWTDSGAIDIADKFHIQWGGRFHDVVDVIHFDLEFLYTVNVDQFLTSIGVDQSKEKALIETPPNQFTELPLKIGTVFALPLVKLDREVLSTETNQVVIPGDYEAFLAKKLIDLLSDTGYERTFTPKTKTFKGDVKETYPYISVWVWSRGSSISSIKETDTDQPSQYNHVIYNITPYIKSLNTNVAENGGNFNITLASLTAEVKNQSNTNDSRWAVKQGTQIAVPVNKKNYVNQAYTHYIENNKLVRNRLFFDKVLQANDLVFIRFERLKMEDTRQNLDELEIIDIHNLPNQIFDMIALVDNVSVDSQFATADIGVSVSGRDLTKLIIEDGVYFYPTEATADGIFSNQGATNTRLLRYNGRYENRFVTSNLSVDRSLKFIINNLGAIEICPSNLFDPYTKVKLKGFENPVDITSKAYQLTDEQKDIDDREERKDADNKRKILDNIDVILKKNNIKDRNSGGVFSTIQAFLTEKIANGQIEVKNNKIQKWIDVEGGITYESKLPNELHDSFVIADRVWVDKPSQAFTYRALLNPNSLAPVSTLNSVYKSASNRGLEKTNAPLIKNLAKNERNTLEKTQPTVRSRYFMQIIAFDQFIGEVETYLKNRNNIISDEQFTFTSDNLKNLKTSYIPNQKNPLFLGIISKNLQFLADDERAVFDDIYNYIVNINSQAKQPKKEELKNLAGIWQIIKLVIDDSVKDRRLNDPTIGNENGSILNAIRKICQDPFCEFYTDTYGDQFYFIARKKPFDKESILSYIEDRAKYDKFTPVEASQVSENEALFQDFTGVPQGDGSPIIKNLTLDIEEVDVISDSLSYSQEVYSWYRLQLSNLSGGDASTMAWAYLKGIYFNEYADIYGSKPLDLSTSYIPWSPVIEKGKELSNAFFIKQGIYDLKYMIESNAYLPFTRQGTIVINGDRRIKRGTFIRYKGTGEIFYVDAVSHSYSIDMNNISRFTTLQVSRGMVEKYIKGVDYSTANIVENPNDLSFGESGTSKINISYFNICDLPIDESIFKNNDLGYSDFSKTSTKKWKVNRQVFNFFLKKMQFATDKEVADSLNLFK